MEIKTNPVIMKRKEKSDVVCFTDDHSIADVVRWLLTVGNYEDVLDCLDREGNRIMKIGSVKYLCANCGTTCCGCSDIDMQQLAALAEKQGFAIVPLEPNDQIRHNIDKICMKAFAENFVADADKIIEEILNFAVKPQKPE